MDLFLQKSLLEKRRSEFEKYLRLLLKWNKIHNLTAITKEEEIWEKHFLDSLAPIQFLQNAASLLDIGSGAGFPGIPLKIARPVLSATLVEATRKKCSFCEAVIRELGLRDIKIIHGHIGDKNTKVNHDKFDAIISRATFSLKEFVSKALPYAKKDTVFIAMKGVNVSEETKGSEKVLLDNRLQIASTEKYILPSSNQERSLVIISHQ